VHDLGFRAGTAVFGHLGIEWDLAAASEPELAELREWISFYKANRDLLLAGDLVRMDAAGDELMVHGVVAPDRSRAIFALATMSTSVASVIPPLRLRGLDPDRPYRVRPVLVGTPPSGLTPPQWWGGSAADGDLGPDLPSTDFAGAVFRGAVLEHTGVAAPLVHPDQVVLFDVTAATSA
jgi:alpha-galactosidase